jgi:hypothetical protein
MMNWQPIIPFSTGLGVAFAERKNLGFGPRSGLFSTQTHAVDNQAAEVVIFDIVPDSFLNRASLEVRGTLTVFGRGEHSTVPYHIHEGFDSDYLDSRQVWTGTLYEIPATGPMHFREISVYDQYLRLWHQAFYLQRHGLAIFAAAVIDDEESASFDKLGYFLAH